ncbi:DUF1223 domain-containing protein [Pontitalea aquivivens]|uniref:DUF1223 domain-containing protein n=1 Tax=Pontitalea aquivivens TaxID=3388663 RepID=UPI00397063D1
MKRAIISAAIGVWIGLGLGPGMGPGMVGGAFGPGLSVAGGAARAQVAPDVTLESLAPLEQQAPAAPLDSAARAVDDGAAATGGTAADPPGNPGLSGAARAMEPEVAAPVAVAPADSAPLALAPVVIELFTSQGCSACPPADALLAQIASRDDVIALALHVDYWDYLGWEDPFAQPAFTARQKAYARAAGERSIYTPQMIVGGAERVVGARPAELTALIEAHRAVAPRVQMRHRLESGRHILELRADPPLDTGAVVQIVRYAPQARVEILRGENAGKIVDYANVVTAWHAVAEWDGRMPLKLTATIEGEEPAVVIVQSARPGKTGPVPGHILSAGRLN